MSLVGALLGSYRITDELSGGGMGTIYRARHELLGREAAVKVLRAELTEDPELVDRFFTEARAATAIRHPSIIEVFDFGYTEAGEAYLVMEFLEGQTLHAFLKQAKPNGLPPPQAAHIARSLSNALIAAHGKGIVHRDLKPANIFLVPDAEQPYGVRPKVLDFGIAKLVDATGAPLGRKHTVTGTLIGTPRYMAPEQARAASQIDHRADLYSLGCILYEMIVGEAPFPKGGSGEVIAMHLFGEVTPPRERVPQLSLELDAIIMKLLQKDPADRYASAAELSKALAGPAGVLRDNVVPVYEATPSPFVRPSVETHIAAPLPFEEDRTIRDRSYAMPIIAALIVLLIGGAVAVGLATQHDAPVPPKPAPVAPTVPMQLTPPAAVVTPPPTPPPVTTTTTKVTAPKPHVQKVPPKQPSCDPKDGTHTASCAPIEMTP
jgi:eukaryotic-like serine/threonine-protein kinase